MESISRTITAWVGEFRELDGVVKEMFYVAREVRKNAQTDYSHYWVGAAGQSAKTGNVYRGCNVERASWTQTTHAEQATLDSMIAAEGKGAKLSRLVLLAGPQNQDIVLPPVVSYARKPWQIRFSQIPAPCGHCLQCIWENCLEDDSVPLYGLLATGEATMITIGDAFPVKFGPADLGIKY